MCVLLHRVWWRPRPRLRPRFAVPDFRCREPNRAIRTEVVKKIAAATKTTTRAARAARAAAEMNGLFLRRLLLDAMGHNLIVLIQITTADAASPCARVPSRVTVDTSPTPHGRSVSSSHGEMLKTTVALASELRLDMGLVVNTSKGRNHIRKGVIWHRDP